MLDELSEDLRKAIDRNSVQDVQRLIEEGADVNAVDNHGITPIVAAYGKPEVARLLVEHGANIDYDGFSEGTLLSLAAFSGDLEVIECCLELGANVNAQLPRSGETALHDAAVKARTPAAIRLLQAGADPNIRANVGKESDIFDGGVKMWGETPLHFAAAYGDAEMIQAMLDAGADRRAENAHGERPLAYAGRHMRDGAIRKLLEQR
ncbi:MAG: ankyrin repeat domain-containing protein [Candidatus Poribacteria bacterium]|nr:ankyrin repeat domain-containing protein [Candidatus Poribacteria bacterium]